MKRIKIVFIGMIITLLIGFAEVPVYAATATPVDSSEILNNAAEYSGSIIAYQGEAIGDVMKRGEYGWVNLHDGNNALGVWAPVSMLDRIDILGGYKYKGDIVAVEGIFRQACPEHGGDIDIHAASLTIIERGKRIEHPFNMAKAITAAALAVAAGLVFLVSRRRLARN